ncbi:DUF6520 family protein [Flagellimonas iocasae]|uniref:DUF6520 family protein n=1 Tax=Flagellimonas iocasae TaxID=2055905 RepID=A0ABW4Y1C4_9FLAO
MKTKMIKFTIPAMAILFAIAASAFTVLEESNTDVSDPITAYIETGNPNDRCGDVEVECHDGSAMDCVYGLENKPVFRDDLGTHCSYVLSKNP